ncbi:protein dml1 [Clonorchis sinensis]|uniref:Protein dml1 n=1 Tax=Clonorchis sinensis TaxID=79923 RepID=H2KP24_CLOSI|nr:protein dml1 [Clonorchis sinensis]
MSDIPASEGREVITLQLGTLSNRIGVHFWNLQQATLPTTSKSSSLSLAASIFDSNVLFESLACSSRPRLLAVDWHDMVDFGAASDWVTQPDPLDSSLWSGKIDRVFRSDSVRGTNSKTIRSPYWTSCLTPAARHLWFEHNIACLIPEALPTGVGHADISVTSFFQGVDILSPGKVFSDEFEDQFRRKIERCSLLNGVQMLVDGEGAFAGIASRFLDYMDEELPKRALLAVPVYHTSALSSLDRKGQLLAKANQLVLLVHLEPSGNHLTRGSWLPFDLSSFNDATDHCFKSGLVAATLDAVTTWMRLKRSHGGVSLDEFISTGQQSHGKRMFSPRVGYKTNDERDDHLTWKSLSPYNLTSESISVGSNKTILWRQFTPRGIQVKCLRPFLADEPSTETSPDTYHPVFRLPGLQSGAAVRIIAAASDLPMCPLLNTNTKRPWCDQPSSVSMISVLDMPGNRSSEATGLQRLFDEVRITSSYPPFEDVEKDLWREYLEMAQTCLVDAYSDNQHASCG